VNFCTSHDLVFSGTIFPHKDCHKVTWVSPDNKTENQIDHVAVGRQWRRSLLDVRNKSVADIGSDHHPVVAKLKLRSRHIN
jgi:endonuclease/exonuclease/phosphatase family metal-dependent hydrolase